MEEAQIALENAARLAGEKGIVRFTRFLDPAQAALCAQLARRYGAAFGAWGGYAQAERAVGCFCPAAEMPDESQYPIVCLHSRYAARYCSVSHRDILGALMALGLPRSCIGDIIIAGADIFLFAHDKTATLIAQSLKSAGRTPLDFCVLQETPDIPAPAGTPFSAVVSSLRLDAVLAAAYRLSRGESAEQIRAGLVKVDHMPCDRVDAPVREGALLSVRGKGRVRLQSVDGTTRKQRIGITCFRYE